ncbi:ComEC/Rec2 family competence protein [candidate division WWE3 bacterium]|uniref:ComEC/Rec2 family competence protein n=1 Tax=candidate division WWE3 bacterium TaxID=2053526 RepID=A0A955LGT7_UNCKA|nr:ComEC/Rec2 family competence protein [candidate division WWE3 bacterium]
MKKYFFVGLVLGIAINIRLWSYHENQLARFRTVIGFSDGPHEVAGLLIGESTLYGKGQFRFSVKEVDGIAAIGELKVEFDTIDSDLSLYHEYLLEGNIQKQTIESISLAETTTIGRMNVVRYEEQDSITSFWLGMFDSVRKNISAHVKTLFPEPHATLIAGIVFGIKENIGKELYQSLVNSGTIHIVVASGFNVAVVMHFATLWSKLVFHRGRYVLLLIMVLSYAAISGFDPPIVRAIFLSFGAIAAELLGEYKAGVTWLFISAYIMVLTIPAWLYSLSFQLSFASTAGIIILLPLMMKRVRVLPKFLSESILTTAAAGVMTMPIIWLNFGRITLVSLITNPLILWSTPWIMGLGFLSVFLSYISIFLARVPGTIAWLLTEYILRIIQYFS